MKIIAFIIFVAVLLNSSSIFGGSFDPSTLKPFTDGSLYLGKYETGLYPGGKNEIPEKHRIAGEKIAATITPLNKEGKPDEKNGKIIGVSMGHSICRQFYDEFKVELKDKSGKINPKFIFFSCAISAQQLPQLAELKGPVWNKVKNTVKNEGYSPLQVQVLFLHTTYNSSNNAGGIPAPSPDAMVRMKNDLYKVLAHFNELYPNIKIAYLTCDGFRHFVGFEPHVWQEAFAFKWLIEDQINGKEGMDFEGSGKKIPWLQWGPYFWDNKWDKTYFNDGVHPSEKGVKIFMDKLWKMLESDPKAKYWLWRK